jgi:hypothetical protein
MTRSRVAACSIKRRCRVRFAQAGRAHIGVEHIEWTVLGER